MIGRNFSSVFVLEYSGVFKMLLEARCGASTSGQNSKRTKTLQVLVHTILHIHATN